MTRATSIALWRAFLVVFGACAFILFFIEFAGLARIVGSGVRVELLFNGGFSREDGPTTFVIRDIPPGSPLNAAGVVAGDKLRYDHPLGPWYYVAPGEPLALTVIHAGVTRRIEVVMRARAPVAGWAAGNDVFGHLLALAALVIGVIIGWRRADSIALRGLSATFMFAATDFPYLAPQAWHVLPLDFVGSVAQALPFAAIVFFALNFPDDAPSGWRRALRRWYPWIFGAHLAVIVVHYSLLYAGHTNVVASYGVRIPQLIEPLLFFVAMLLGWRSSVGETRVRFQWMLGTIGAMVAVAAVQNVNQWTGRWISDEALGFVSLYTTAAGMAGLLYAIFRHRVFDFGFAINRALVYGIASAILLLTFFLLEKLAEHYIHVEGRDKNALIDGVIALGVFLFFHRVRHWVEHHLERIFFNKWHENESRLRKFLALAEHVTKPESLVAALSGEIERFTGGAGHAIYRQGADGQYTRVATTIDDAPAGIDADDPLVVVLRAEREPSRIDDARSQLPALLAFPITLRAALDGFVLVAAKPSGEAYRPDETALLGFAINQVGRDLHALDAALWKSEAAALRAGNQELRGLVERALGAADIEPVRANSIKMAG